MSKIKQSINLELVRQLIKFAVVGSMGTAVQYLILYIFVNLYNTTAVFGSSLGFIFGAVINHHYNRSFTFNTNKSYFSTLIHFMGSATWLFCVNLLTMYICVEALNLHYLFSQLIATALVFLMGFIINKFFVFSNN